MRAGQIGAERRGLEAILIGHDSLGPSHFTFRDHSGTEHKPRLRAVRLELEIAGAEAA
jgi:hypothetical protein